jgi:hypothetical protein
MGMSPWSDLEDCFVRVSLTPIQRLVVEADRDVPKLTAGDVCRKNLIVVAAIESRFHGTCKRWLLPSSSATSFWNSPRERRGSRSLSFFMCFQSLKPCCTA